MSAITRRRLLTTVLAAAGTSGLAMAARLAHQYGLVPPDSGGIYGVGETLTYATQHLLTGRHSMAREFNRGDISRVAPVNGDPPGNDTYERLAAADFAGWRLIVDGLVARPSAFSLAEIKRFPAVTQITHQACEEGWSFIAAWTGVPLSHVLNAAGVSPRARYVVFIPFDDSWDSVDMDDAWHPQTLLAYAMNGAPLPPGHGAPLRVRVPRQLGYKSVKYLSRLTVVDSLARVRNGLGSVSPDYGYSWYAGI